LNLLLESRQANEDVSYQLLLEKLTPKQCLKVKGPVVDMDNRFNEIFPSFDLFNKKFTSGDRLIDIFLAVFPFILQIDKVTKALKHMSITLTIFLSKCSQIQNMLLLYLMLVSRTKLLSP